MTGLNISANNTIQKTENWEYKLGNSLLKCYRCDFQFSSLSNLQAVAERS